MQQRRNLEVPGGPIAPATSGSWSSQALGMRVAAGPDMQRTLFAIPLLMFACGTQPPAPESEPEVEASAAVTLDAALAARGFLVQPGSFEFLDMTQCCETSCSGNNP